MAPPAHDPHTPPVVAHAHEVVDGRRRRRQKKLELASDLPILPGMKAGHIVELREALGLSVKEFAALVGVEFSSVYRWESGKGSVQSSRVRDLLTDLYEKHVKAAPLDYSGAKLYVAKRLGVDIEAAARLLQEYGRAPGEGWRAVAERVVDGERYKGLHAANG